MNRREALALLALAPLGTLAVGRTGAAVPAPPIAAPRRAPAAGPLFFTPQELATVTVLADLVIPADERSGSASQAGVPEYVDYMLHDSGDERAQTEMRGGLAWLDAESRRRHGAAFTAVTGAQQAAILDDIAWPDKADPRLSQGVAFFSRFRDMVASGFWSSRTGVEDLRYRGNTVVPVWTGCPPEALAKLGVSYD
ncbi:MAG TPA: gluconate 2-dehydrogenase subunit 3 family protein [Longimicrobiaceae bacterium]|nr:gluconate 2-dehydrogenase subunit 3 family protein [Longimicrobiaceae bacterium]